MLNYAPKNLRVRPDHNFKVGDWVYANNYLCKLGATKNETLYTPIRYGCDGILGVKLPDLSELRVWQPTEGELIYSKDNCGTITVEEYSCQTDVYPFIGEKTWLLRKG